MQVIAGINKSSPVFGCHGGQASICQTCEQVIGGILVWLFSDKAATVCIVIIMVCLWYLKPQEIRLRTLLLVVAAAGLIFMIFL